MGKKHKHGKTAKPSASDLLKLKVLREEEWSFDARASHLSYREMSRRVALPTADGGLGYAISPERLSALVKRFYERMADVLTESPALHLERELSDLDLLSRAAGGAMARAEAAGAYDVNAAREYRAIGERRARLLGLDSAGPAEATASDAPLVELNAALVRLGQKPLGR